MQSKNIPDNRHIEIYGP